MTSSEHKNLSPGIGTSTCVLLSFQADLCLPKGIYMCDGSNQEGYDLIDDCVHQGMLTKLNKLDSW